VSCNLCAGHETRPFKRKAGYTIVTCRVCGLVFVNPRPDAERLLAHYNGNSSSRIQYYLDAERADRRSFAEVLDVAQRLQPAGGALLDIGPNVGTCLDLARTRGFAVRGIEINAEAARYCREQRGLDVLGQPLAPGVFPEASFDVILMGDVIEHLPDPLGALRCVRSLLRPGGIALISTPDVAGWAARALQVKPEEHLYYFTPATMRRALTSAGLEVLELHALDRYHNLTGMVHSTTFGGLFQTLAPLLRGLHRVLGDVIVRLPLRENLLAVAQRPPDTRVPA
jgi:2-polyprenyl-3-methyl-5-hydroxy-6-metoxy-1,4-benzoquinol methylase